MRILLVPHTGLRNIKGDSNYLLFIDLAKHFISKGNFVHMIMPEFAREKVERIKGLMYHFVPHEHNFYTEYAIHDARELVHMFSRKAGKYQIDGCILAKAMQVPFMRALLSDVLRCRDIECYIIEPGVYEEKVRGIIKGQMQLMLTSMGYANSTSVFLSEKEKVIALKTASRWLSPALVKQMDKESLVLPVGVPCNMIDEKTKGIEKYDKFTLFFGARLNSVKQPHKIIEVFSDFYEYGRTDVQIKFTSNTQETKFFAEALNKEAMKGRENLIDIYFGCPREEYLKIAKASHVAMCWSTEEGFPVGFWEQMYMGLPVLFPNREWATRQLPKDYPWIYRDNKEAYAMISYIKDNYEKVSKDMEKMKDFIREKYNDKIIYGTIEKDLEEKLKRKYSYVMPRALGELAERAGELFDGQPFSMAQLLMFMEELGYSFKRQQKYREQQAKFPSDYDIYRHMISHGYKDLCNKATPLFQKEV